MTGSTEDPKLLRESLYTFAPTWARSVNISLTVQKWPSNPLLSLRVPLDDLPTGPVSTKNGQAWLTLDKVTWSRTSNAVPEQPCLKLTVRFANTGQSGYSRSDYRARDESGGDLDLSSVRSSENGGVGAVDFQIIGIKKGTKWFDFAIFSPEQLRANEVVLRFEGMSTD